MEKLFSLLAFASFAVGAIIHYYNTTAKQALLKLSTSKERIMYRENVFKQRIKIICKVICFPIIFIFCFFLLVIVVNYFDESSHDYKMWLSMFFSFFAIIIIIAVPLGIIIFMQYKGNLSYYDKNAFLRETNTFVLYLRGFEKDNYSNIFRLSFIKPKGFSEYNFTKIVSKKYLCAAIGMTIELDAPLGAKRIYVDDNTWKDDVMDLIDKAKIVFILVNNRPSCLWEIESSAKYLNKTVFIVDNPVKYVLVQEEVKEIIHFPIISSLSMNNRFFYLKSRNGIFEYHEYNNTRKGYQKLFKESLQNESI